MGETEGIIGRHLVYNIFNKNKALSMFTNQRG